MSQLIDTLLEEPQPIIGAEKHCEQCGDRMINDEVWGWLHVGETK